MSNKCPQAYGFCQRRTLFHGSIKQRLQQTPLFVFSCPECFLTSFHYIWTTYSVADRPRIPLLLFSCLTLLIWSSPINVFPQSFMLLNEGFAFRDGQAFLLDVYIVVRWIHDKRWPTGLGLKLLISICALCSAFFLPKLIPDFWLIIILPTRSFRMR